MSKKIGITCDHAGFQMKEFLVGWLSSKGFEVLDYGCYSEESVDYPDFAHAIAKGFDEAEISRGIALCGSGEGMSITLNKYKGVRAGLCWCEEIAALIRQHNDANFLVLPARFITNDEARSMVDIWIETPFEGGRHQTRVNKILL